MTNAIFWMLAALIFCLLAPSAVIIYLEVSHKKERKDLVDRIMVKDYQEYLKFKESKKPTSGRNFIRKYQVGDD